MTSPIPEPDVAKLVEEPKQPFERYPALAYWIETLAHTPGQWSLRGWDDFLAALNGALEQAALDLLSAGRQGGDGTAQLTGKDAFMAQVQELRPALQEAGKSALPEVEELIGNVRSYPKADIGGGSLQGIYNRLLADARKAADALHILSQVQGEGSAQSQPGYDGGRAASAEAALIAAERRVRYLEDKLLEIVRQDWHERTPPKPKPETGGMRGWAGHKAAWALTGLNGSMHGDAAIEAALEAERRKPWAAT